MTNAPEKPEFWEAAFAEKQEMWGFTPATSAVLAKDLFVGKGIQQVLIPGFGYGRNAQVFREAGLAVTGIEIAQTAIDLARKHYGPDLTIYHGSVTDMPFDARLYDGIFCHALLHLLSADERCKLLTDCYNQLAENGYMVFTVISSAAPTYGQGRPVGPDRYEMFGGVTLQFYREESIRTEFADVGLVGIDAVEENYPFFLVTCQKGAG